MEITFKDIMNFTLFLFAGALGITMGIAIALADPALANAWQDTGWAVLVVVAIFYFIFWYAKRQWEEKEAE